MPGFVVQRGIVQLGSVDLFNESSDVVHFGIWQPQGVPIQVGGIEEGVRPVEVGDQFGIVGGGLFTPFQVAPEIAAEVVEVNGGQAARGLQIDVIAAGEEGGIVVGAQGCPVVIVVREVAVRGARIRFPNNAAALGGDLPGEEAFQTLGTGDDAAGSVHLKNLRNQRGQVEFARREPIQAVILPLFAVRAQHNTQEAERAHDGHFAKGVKWTLDFDLYCVGVVFRDQFQRAVAAGGDNDGGQDGVERGEGAVGLKDQGFGQVGIVDADLGVFGNEDDQGIGRVVELFQSEGELRFSRRRRTRLYVQQLQKLDVIQVGQPVQPVENRLRHPGVQFDQRHAGIGVVEVGPFRRITGNTRPRFSYQLIKRAIVQIRCR